MKSYRYIKIYTGGYTMNSKPINELIEEPTFKEELKKFLQIDSTKNVDVTFSDDENVQDNITYKIFVLTDDKNFIVTLGYKNNNYNFLEYEDIYESIENDKFNFDIDYWSYNITYDQLARLFKSGKIKIPDMQRGFVWDDIQASRLIESILMGLPLPSLFLIKNIEEGNYLVVDGLQRLTTIYSFRYNKRLPNRNTNIAGFSLKGVHESIRNKTYDELSEEGKTDKFDMGTINVIEFKQNKPDHEEAMYTLFERLNGGGTNLSPQQIRNSIYYGEFNNLLNIYSKLIDKYFSKKAVLSLAPSENLLRIIAIYNYIDSYYKELLESNYAGYQELTPTIAYKKIYNKTAKKYHMDYKVFEIQSNGIERKENSEELEKLFKDIELAITACESIFGDDAFTRYDEKKGEFLNRFTPVLLESLVVTMLLNKNKTLKDRKTILDDFKNLFKPEKEFDQYFSQGTGRLKNIFGRIVSLEKVLYQND